MALMMESAELTLEQPTQKPFKIAIVGPEEAKWEKLDKFTLLQASNQVKAMIYRIFKDHATKIKVGSGYTLHYEYDFSNIILVSGHCPKGGVDIWAEEIADELGIEKEIYPADTEGWEDEYLDYGGRNKGYKSRNMDIAEACDILYCIVPSVDVTSVEVYGKKTVALSTDDGKIPYCYHCKTIGHPANGGCWTKKYADSIGKPTHLVLIN